MGEDQAVVDGGHGHQQQAAEPRPSDLLLHVGPGFATEHGHDDDQAANLGLHARPTGFSRPESRSASHNRDRSHRIGGVWAVQALCEKCGDGVANFDPSRLWWPGSCGRAAPGRCAGGSPAARASVAKMRRKSCGGEVDRVAADGEVGPGGELVQVLIDGDHGDHAHRLAPGVDEQVGEWFADDTFVWIPQPGEGAAWLPLRVRWVIADRTCTSSGLATSIHSSSFLLAGMWTSGMVSRTA
jgi:hypothetical protein